MCIWRLPHIMPDRELSTATEVSLHSQKLGVTCGESRRSLRPLERTRKVWIDRVGVEKNSDYEENTVYLDGTSYKGLGDKLQLEEIEKRFQSRDRALGGV